MKSAKILLVHDQRLIRAGLNALLQTFAGMSVVAEAANGREALTLAGEHKPDVVLMDISIPTLDGLEATRRIVRGAPEVKVLVLSSHGDEEYVRQALKIGASGYLLKDAGPWELELAIRTVCDGEVFLSPAVSRRAIDFYLLNTKIDSSSLALLTPRQKEVLKLIAEGKSTREIAITLGTSVKTIESHRAGVMERLGIHDVAGLVRYAVRVGLVSLDK